MAELDDDDAAVVDEVRAVNSDTDGSARILKPSAVVGRQRSARIRDQDRRGDGIRIREAFEPK